MAVLSLIGFLFFSCNNGKADAPIVKGIDSPPWLEEVPPEDVLWGIGSAKQSSDSMSMTTAEQRARVSIVQQLSTRIQVLFTDQGDVSRSITNMELTGARPIKRWKAPDGTWWCLVEYSKANAKNDMAKVFNSKATGYGGFKADEALRRLDAQLSKPEKPLPMNN